MDPELIELSKSYFFIDLWYNWTIRYADELSVRNKAGYAFRGGTFYRGGASKGQHRDDWPAFFALGQANNLTYTGIHALFSYLNHPSFKIYWDSRGADFRFLG